MLGYTFLSHQDLEAPNSIEQKKNTERWVFVVKGGDFEISHEYPLRLIVWTMAQLEHPSLPNLDTSKTISVLPSGA